MVMVINTLDGINTQQYPTVFRVNRCISHNMLVPVMSIKIHLDDPGILSPGATISGTVICHFEHPEVVRGITCVFKGREYTHWDVQRSRNSVKFHGKNDFVNQVRQFAHAGTLPARTYKYQFVFNLPDRQLPSSFLHDCAAIQYFIKAKVDRPLGFDYKDSVSLHVASPVDLNDFVDQISMRPLRNQLEEFPSCCFFTSEPLLLDFTINKDAFVVGETIFVKINVNNTSSLHVSEVKLSLIQVGAPCNCSSGYGMCSSTYKLPPIGAPTISRSGSANVSTMWSSCRNLEVPECQHSG
uniref:Arrestin domain-containing protein 3-like n=1 Tax=Diabrotica virgifera virgifera TaxID=50390 RepID=A0A6P7F8Z0_DIAVI